MIKFKGEDEKAFVEFYANKLGDELVGSVLNGADIANSDEAIHLSNFFWDMVDAAIQDEKMGVDVGWSQSSEFLSEKVMYAFSGYLEQNGYEEEWEKVSDLRN